MNRPLLGWGPETFGASFPRYQSIELARAYPDFYHESPHNLFLDEFADQGICGLLVFLGWTGFAGRAAWPRLNGPAPDAPLAIAFLAGLISLQFNAFVVTTEFYFFLTSALVLMIEEEFPTDAVSARPWHTPVAGFSLAAVFAVFAIRLCVADAAMAKVRTQLEAGNVCCRREPL